MVKKMAVASSQGHLSMLQVSDLKGCGNYGPDNILKRKKKTNDKNSLKEKQNEI